MGGLSSSRVSSRATQVAAGLYALYFLALFAQFPLAGRLPGNCDTWYAIAFTNLYLNEVRGALGGEDPGSFMYPVATPFSYGETSLALAVAPMALRAIGLSDVLAYYFFISFVYAGTALGACLVATLYVRDRAAAFVAGLLVATCNYMLSTIDSPHTAFLGVALLSFYFFARYVDSERKSDLMRAAALAGLQVYLSAYVFLLLGVMIGALGLVHLKKLLDRPGQIRRLAASLALVTGVILPFFVFYVTRLTGHFSWRGQAVLFAEFNSLDPQDVFNPMPDNLIYPEGHRFIQDDAMILQGQLGKSDPAFRTETFALLVGNRPRDDEESLWVSSRRRAFVGLIPYGLAILGLARGYRGRRDTVVLFVVGFILALGPGFNAYGAFVRLPLYWLYEYLPGFHMFRIPSRAFVISILALSIAMAKGLELVLDRFGRDSRARRLGLVALVGALLVVENVPFPMRSFEGSRLVRPPAEYVRFFSGREPSVVLNLPSGIGYGLAGSADDLYAFNRELVYMNWQTYHRHTITNGVNGYIPLERIEVQKLVAALPSPTALSGLRHMGVDYIVFNEDLLLGDERSIAGKLRASRELDCVLDGPSTVVFELRR